MSPRSTFRVKASLEAAHYTVSKAVFEAGEHENASRPMPGPAGFCAWALRALVIVVALGGGVVDDSGIRGCHLHARYSLRSGAHSLLACVDSSVGGKTAVDLPEGKNLVGAFFQPDAVLIDVSLLATLPEHFIDGCGEVLKYGVIFDKELFAQFEACAASDMRLPGDRALR